MNFHFSPITKAVKTDHGGNFLVYRLDLQQLNDFISPVVGFDHFCMSGPTFSPHPHAGFSAISYIFEDSKGGLRNRDSLGHDLIVHPGEILWTQSGSGVIHDEFPAKNGVAVHGLQLFINLSSKHKHLAPQMFYTSLDSIPVLSDVNGNRIRILSGQFDGISSPIVSAEDVDFFDIWLQDSWEYLVKSDWNTMIYVLDGTAVISLEGTKNQLETHEAIGIQAGISSDVLNITTNKGAHVLLISGKDPKEPVATYGPFIMNTQNELNQAYERYRTGQMGHLA